MFAQKTLYQLMNDGLMPELFSTIEDRLFRRYWGFFHGSILKKAPLFIDPTPAFKEAGLSVSQDLLDEWNQMKHLGSQNFATAPYEKLNIVFPQDAKMRLFVLLCWQSLHFSFEFLKYDIEKEATQQLKQFHLMEFMTQLEQLMNDNRLEIHFEKEIRAIFHELMAIYWLKTYSSYPTLLHIKSLSYFEEELRALFKPGAIALSLFPLDFTGRASAEVELACSPASELDTQNVGAQAQLIQKDLETIKGQIKLVSAGRSIQQAEQYLKPYEAAQFLHISTQTLSNWRISGKLSAYRKNGNRYEYLLKGLEKIKKECNP